MFACLIENTVCAYDADIVNFVTSYAYLHIMHTSQITYIIKPLETYLRVHYAYAYQKRHSLIITNYFVKHN